MTIKPIVAPSAKRSGVGPSDGDKDSHAGAGVSDGPSGSSHQTASRSTNVHAHRNVAIDGHGQSPQRRVDVYDDLTRHRRSPHKTVRSKRREHHAENHHNKRDKHTDKLGASMGTANSKCNSPLSSGSGASSSAAGIAAASSNTTHSSGVGNNSPNDLLIGSQSPTAAAAAVAQSASGLLKAIEEISSGYNSGDEHLQPKERQTTADEWQRRDEQFAKAMADRGYILKQVEEDGACLFRSISLQIYGDEEMHDVIRQHTMDYIYKNREYFSHFVTEDINSYIKRKRRKDSHGNHIEIQAMSEIYNRPVEVYCYEPTPINIFNSEQSKNGYEALRLSYQRGSHYNAILDPYNATVGLGLGLAGYKPDLQTKEAARLSEQLEIEQTMFEDKLKTTDWEATNEAIEEQIARESYLQWCRENMQKTRTPTSASTSATVTSGQAVADAEAATSTYAIQRLIGNSSNKNSTVTSINANCTQSSSSSVSANNTTAEHSFAMTPLAPLSLNATEEGGFESDDTDMSSTSSSSSPSSASRTKANLRNSSSARSSKKRKRVTKSSSEEAETARKSPKREDTLSAADLQTRSETPDFENQKPCTSKQSHSPDKRNTANSTAETSSATGTNEPPANPENGSNNHGASSFYQELLEASYANYGEMSESELLQRAIQMSTNDYIEDQKRKYLYGP